MLGAVLLAVLALSVAVLVLAFTRGEEARRQAAAPGPRAFRSIGEAVRVAKTRPGARVVVLFAGDDPASLAALQAFADDPGVVAQLEAPDLLHAIVRSHGDERQVADVLFAKYARRPLPAAGPACLLLDPDGGVIAAADVEGPLPGWLAPWLARSGHLAPRSS
jgi:hypothetical protein